MNYIVPQQIQRWRLHHNQDQHRENNYRRGAAKAETPLPPYDYGIKSPLRDRSALPVQRLLRTEMSAL